MYGLLRNLPQTPEGNTTNLCCVKVPNAIPLNRRCQNVGHLGFYGSKLLNQGAIVFDLPYCLDAHLPRGVSRRSLSCKWSEHLIINSPGDFEVSFVAPW